MNTQSFKEDHHIRPLTANQFRMKGKKCLKIKNA